MRTLRKRHGLALTLAAVLPAACSSTADRASESIRETSHALTAHPSTALAWLTGDVNHDNKTDVIVPMDDGIGGLQMRVYPSDGTGYTVGWSGALPNASAALAWLTGDVNGDGKTDVIQPFSNGGRLGINVYQSDGTGYVKTWSSSNMGQGANALAWLTGDVNGDGKTDIIQPWSNGGRLGMIVYQSNGSGYVTTFGTQDIGEVADALAWLTGDVNGDGKTDIIQPWSNGGALGMIVYQSNGTGYTPAFGSSNMGQGAGALAWLTGDVNGDGKTDIIQPWANGSRLGMIVYESNGDAYTMTFGTQDIGEGGGALAWLVGDMNADQKTDLMQPWSNGGTLGIIDYRATGPGYAIQWGTSDIGQKADALAWLTGDVNGDGKVDIIQPRANGGTLGMAVYTSNGSSHVCSWTSNDLGPAPGAAMEQSFLAPATWGHELAGKDGWDADHLRLVADVDGDGKQDLVGFGYAGVYTARSMGQQFEGAKFVLPQFGIDHDWSTSKDVRTLADIDGDGRADIVGFGNDGVYTALSNGAAFAPARRVIADFGYDKGWRLDKHVRTLADVNRDGRADLVAFGDEYVWLALADGSGAFGTPTAVLHQFTTNAGNWTPSKHVRTLADVNGDGQADIVGFGEDGVWTALSTGTSFAAPQFVLAEFGYDAGVWRVDRHLRVLSDINADGKQDIVAFGDDGVWTALSNGAGFDAAKFVLADMGYKEGWRVDTNPRFVTDLNRDGYPDLVGYGTEAVYRSLGGPTGFTPMRGVLRDLMTTSDLRTVGDVDGDGRTDLIDIGATSDLVAQSTSEPPPPPPAAPMPIFIGRKTTSTIAVQWTDNSTNERDFILRYWEQAKKGEGAQTLILPANTTSTVLSSLSSATDYCFTVQAEGEFDISAPTLDCTQTIPEMPEISLVNATDTTLTFRFHAPRAGGYDSTLDPSAGNRQERDYGNDVQRTFTGLTGSTQYCVHARSALAEVSDWATLCASTTATPPKTVDLEIRQVFLGVPGEYDDGNYSPPAESPIAVTWTECFTAGAPAYTVKVYNDLAEVYSVKRDPSALAKYGTACVSSKQLSSEVVEATAGQAGDHDIIVVVDSDNEVAETDEGNNKVDDGYRSQ